MANSLFNSLGGNMPMNNMAQQFNSFRSNPMQYLIQKRINIPQEFANNPRGAVQYLMNNGQMSQQQFNNLSQLAQQMGIKLN